MMDIPGTVRFFEERFSHNDISLTPILGTCERKIELGAKKESPEN